MDKLIEGCIESVLLTKISQWDRTLSFLQTPHEFGVVMRQRPHETFGVEMVQQAILPLGRLCKLQEATICIEQAGKAPYKCGFDLSRPERIGTDNSNESSTASVADQGAAIAANHARAIVSSFLADRANGKIILRAPLQEMSFYALCP
jgi:hypothetical protein